MPRNGSGVYSLPAGNPVVSGTTIQATWANGTMTDVADALTGSIARDGTGGMTGALRLADGTVAIPGLAFTAETTTGFSRPTANAIVASVAATERVRINASGATVTGALSVSSDAAIGTTSALGRLHVRSAADVNLFLRDAAAVGLSSGNILESFNNATSATVPIYLRASSFTFGADSGGSFVQRMELDASGNLGVGVTPSAWSNINALEFAGGFFGASSALMVNGHNCYFDGTNWRAKVTGESNYNVLLSGSFIWNSAASVTAGSVTTPVERMRLDASGNLGIGTASPTTKLDVNGAVKASGDGSLVAYYMPAGQAIRQDGSATTMYIDLSSGGTAGSLVIRNGSGFTTQATIDASGNLGLGVTPSAWFSDRRVTQIGSGASVNGSAATRSFVEVGANFYHNASSADIYIATEAASKYRQFSGAHAWYTAPSGTAGNAITFTQAMTLDASGNLGVGTASPGNKLDVSVTRSYGQSADVGIALGGADNGYVNNGATSSWRQYVAGNDTGQALRFDGFVRGTGWTERMRLDTSGNLGIGTASPGSKLDVAGRIAATNSQAFVFNGTTGTYGSFQYNGTIVGDVGTANQVMSGGANTDFAVSSRAATALVLGTNTVERMRISSSGNVGVGTASPTEKLDVNGTVKATLFSGSGASLTNLPAPAALSTASGSAPSYSARAWVNFNGTTASPSTIRASGNVSSVTKAGTGDYTINFSTAMPDADYAVSGSASDNSNVPVVCTNTYAAGSLRILVINGVGGVLDRTYVNVVIFR